MPDPREVLREIQQRADAATQGPWLPGYDQKGNRAGWGIVARTEAASIRGGDPRPIALTIFPAGGWSTEADGRFVASARADVPRLVAALTAVLDLHRPVQDVDARDEPGERYYSSEGLFCGHCGGWGDDYPCETVKAIASTLEVSSA